MRFTCFLRWLSAWCAALWFPALCSVEPRPERPTWRRTETTRLCRPSPSSHRSRGRLSPWKPKHTPVRPIRKLTPFSFHCKNQLKRARRRWWAVTGPGLTSQRDQWRGRRCRWRRRRCDKLQTHFLLRPPEDPDWWPAPPSFLSLYEEPSSEEDEEEEELDGSVNQQTCVHQLKTHYWAQTFKLSFQSHHWPSVCFLHKLQSCSSPTTHLQFAHYRHLPSHIYLRVGKIITTFKYMKQVFQTNISSLQQAPTSLTPTSTKNKKTCRVWRKCSLQKTSVWCWEHL